MFRSFKSKRLMVIAVAGFGLAACSNNPVVMKPTAPTVVAPTNPTNPTPPEPPAVQVVAGQPGGDGIVLSRVGPPEPGEPAYVSISRNGDTRFAEGFTPAADFESNGVFTIQRAAMAHKVGANAANHYQVRPKLDFRKEEFSLEQGGAVTTKAPVSFSGGVLDFEGGVSGRHQMTSTYINSEEGKFGIAGRGIENSGSLVAIAGENTN